MSASDYQRDVRCYLWEAYGVGASLRHMTNHDRLEFEYPPGTARNLTLHRSPGKVKNSKLLVAIKKQDIRRLLGPPPHSVQQKEEIAMPQLVSIRPVADTISQELKAKPSVVAMGRVACYAGGRVKFHVPAEIATVLAGVGLLVTRNGSDWEISKRPGYKTPAVHEFKPGFYTIEAGNNMYSKALSSGYEPFAPTPAEFLLEGDVVLIRLTHAPTSSPAVRTKRHVVEALSAPQGQNSDLHQTLKMIADIECTTPYRLAKNTEGRWMFKAPTVFLD